MQLLADENIPASVVRELRNVGHSVEWVSETIPGADDATVLRRAIELKKILITQDKAFASAAMQRRAGGLTGFILLRLEGVRRQDQAAIIRLVLDSRQDWAGHLAVIKKNSIRLRKLRE
jgi:predicted nuclease of predicted toxin-antitoxin system